MATGTIKSSIRNYSISSPYTLTQSVNYTCPSDGYLTISCSNLTKNYCYGYVNNTLLIAVGTPMTEASENNQCSSLFVRKGMKIKYLGSSGAAGYFFPIVEQ